MTNSNEILIRDDKKEFEKDLEELIDKFDNYEGDIDEATTVRGYQFYLLDDLFIRVDDMDYMILAYKDIESTYGKIIHIGKSSNATSVLDKKLRSMYYRMSVVYPFKKIPMISAIQVGPGSFEENNKNFLNEFIEYVKINKKNIRMDYGLCYYIHDNLKFRFEHNGDRLYIESIGKVPDTATKANKLTVDALVEKLMDLYEN